MIRIENLQKIFNKDVVALDDLTLQFDEGTFVALLGPSGCGKTTTLNCIAGLLEPSSGKIYFDEQDVTELEPKDRNIGMVFQSYALYPHMKVIDNIAFSLKQKGIKKEERHEKAREIAKTLQIEHLLMRRPSELSGGQQQRVSMARALVKNPRVLLLDEPMSNLDARLKIEIRDEIKRIQQNAKVTAILVTHDQEEAMAMADKIAILDNGKIQQFDTPEVLYHKPKNLFVAHFMGNPPMNFINGTLTKDGENLCFLTENHKMQINSENEDKIKKYTDKEAVIGVRSHVMTINKDNTGVPMKFLAVENLGKELMVTGYIGKDFVRISISNDIQEQYKYLLNLKSEKEPIIYLTLNEYNVFDKDSGENISL